MGKYSKYGKYVRYCILFCIIIVASASYVLMKPSHSMCILLTTTVNVDKGIHNTKLQKNESNYRLKQYLDVIDRYLNNSTLPLYVVESSGYDFPEYKNNPRVNIFSYNLNIVFNGYSTKSPMEAMSIVKAYNYFGLNKYNHIIKITGKYYIPKIDYHLSKVDKNVHYIIQNTEHKPNTPYLKSYTEILGFKSDKIQLFYDLTDMYYNNNTIEYKTMQFKQYLKNSCTTVQRSIVIEPYFTYILNNTDEKYIYQLPKLKLDKEVERGCVNCSRNKITHL